MRGNAMISENSQKTLDRAILVAGLSTLAVIVFMLISTGLSHFQKNEADAKLALAKNEKQTLDSTIEKAKLISLKPSSAKELGIVQVELSRFAKKNECRLMEVSSSGEPGLFTSKYIKGSDARGWKQLPIDCQIVGSLVNVMTMIREFSMISIPIEVQSIDVLPIGQSETGVDNVSAKVTFQILKQEATK